MMLLARRRALVAAAVLGALAVATGAFGAHGLSGRVSPHMLDVWQTAVRYHMWHVLALLAACALEPLWGRRSMVAACSAWLAGIALFSGSLYLLVLTGIGILGAITPVGGVVLIAGWVLLASAALGAGRA